MSIRFRAGLPTLINNEPVPQQKVRSTAQQKKAVGQSSDPPPKLTADQQTLAAHNRKVLEARKAVALAKQAAAHRALALAQANAQEADTEETAAEAAEVTEVSSASTSSTILIPSLTPAISPLVQTQQSMMVAARPQPARVFHGPATNLTRGKPQPIGRPNR